MKKAVLLCTFLALLVVGINAQDLQPVTGIASQSDAQRHYLLHLAALQNSAASGVSSMNDNAVAMSTAKEFDTWFNNAVQGFNDVQTTVKDPTEQQSRLNDFLKQRDDQVAYYHGQLVTKLSPVGRSQLSQYIANSREHMQSGIPKEQYDKMQLTQAERKSSAKLGGSQGNYQCNFSGFTCNVTYSLAAAVSGTAATPALDTFQRANGGVGTNWTIDTGTFAVSNNHVIVTSGGGGGTAFMHWHPTSFTANQFSQIIVTGLPAAHDNIGVTVRCTGAGVNCYFASLENNGNGTYSIYPAKYVNGVYTGFPNFYTYAAAVNDTIALLAQGTTLSVTVNGRLVLEFEDSSIATGNPGILGTASGGSADYWQGGNLGLSMTFNPILDGTENMPGNVSATHTPAVSITLNGAKSSANGNGVCTSCYLLANHNFLDGFVGGDGGTLNDGADIQCSVAGVFFSTTDDSEYIEAAYTTALNIDQNHSQGSKVWAGNCPDGNCQWEEPNMFFQPSNLDTLLYAWNFFTTAPYVGYEYQVQNWCSNTTGAGEPDADYTAFKVVLPEIYLTGGTWGIEPIPTQGGTVQFETLLFRVLTNQPWSTIPRWGQAYLTSFGDDPWNLPATHTSAQLAMDGYNKKVCTVTDTGGTNGANRYKVSVGTSNVCIEHVTSSGLSGHIVNCTH